MNCSNIIAKTTESVQHFDVFCQKGKQARRAPDLQEKQPVHFFRKAMIPGCFMRGEGRQFSRKLRIRRTDCSAAILTKDG